jgi:hypothetical protein
MVRSGKVGQGLAWRGFIEQPFGVWSWHGKAQHRRVRSGPAGHGMDLFNSQLGRGLGAVMYGCASYGLAGRGLVLFDSLLWRDRREATLRGAGRG